MRVITRGYELASHGVLPPSAYLRYLEHMRWQCLSTDGALPLRSFWKLGVVRAQSLHIQKDVSFHVELDLSLWVSRVGTTSFDFSHEIVRVEDGALVAVSTATVVALDSDRRPTPISSEARQYVVERPGAIVSRPLASRPENAWSAPVSIRLSDQDLQQHVNHARYADFIEDARLVCARARGYGEGRWDGRVRRLRLEYEREARFGDDVVVRTWRVAGTPADLEFCLEAGGTVVARARVEVET